MPFKKKTIKKDKKEELFELLKARTPGLFEKEPRSAVTDSKLEELVEEISKIK